jgi:hypothetical protein
LAGGQELRLIISIVMDGRSSTKYDLWYEIRFPSQAVSYGLIYEGVTVAVIESGFISNKYAVAADTDQVPLWPEGPIVHVTQPERVLRFTMDRSEDLAAFFSRAVRRTVDEAVKAGPLSPGGIAVAVKWTNHDDRLQHVVFAGTRMRFRELVNVTANAIALAVAGRGLRVAIHAEVDTCFSGGAGEMVEREFQSLGFDVAWSTSCLGDVRSLSTMGVDLPKLCRAVKARGEGWDRIALGTRHYRSVLAEVARRADPGTGTVGDSFETILEALHVRAARAADGRRAEMGRVCRRFQIPEEELRRFSEGFELVSYGGNPEVLKSSWSRFHGRMRIGHLTEWRRGDRPDEAPVTAELLALQLVGLAGALSGGSDQARGGCADAPGECGEVGFAERPLGDLVRLGRAARRRYVAMKELLGIGMEDTLIFCLGMKGGGSDEGSRLVELFHEKYEIGNSWPAGVEMAIGLTLAVLNGGGGEAAVRQAWEGSEIADSGSAPGDP